MNFIPSKITTILACCCLLSPAGRCVAEAPGGRVVVKYWEKWTGFEADAMREVVDDFNSSQDRIFVDYSSVSQIDRRLMLATAGGVPPDIAGIWAGQLPAYSENNALTPLDSLAREAGISAADYIPAFWEICNHREHLWALPSTPTSVALIYNKKMFREAGLDPERPPRTIAELEEFNEKLTKRGPDGRIITAGHLPEEPGWWSQLWGFWFGGELWDGDRKITTTDPKVIEAFEWVESYPKRFGAHPLLAMRDGFGNFASPQNAFFTGRVAMILQGVWIYNFITNYAPADFEWGVAPFPAVNDTTLKNTTLVECDVLVIPAGAKHPREAFEFMRYVNTRGPMEKLCLGQRKFSPLKENSEEFLNAHPNPHIRTFLELAKSPNARIGPRMTTWAEYSADLRNAIGRIWSGKADTRTALQDVQERQQEILDRRLQRWDRISPALIEQWNQP